VRSSLQEPPKPFNFWLLDPFAKGVALNLQQSGTSVRIEQIQLEQVRIFLWTYLASRVITSITIGHCKDYIRRKA